MREDKKLGNGYIGKKAQDLNRGRAGETDELV